MILFSSFFFYLMDNDIVSNILEVLKERVVPFEVITFSHFFMIEFVNLFIVLIFPDKMILSADKL